jgi:RluA family pseudouridine synthase
VTRKLRTVAADAGHGLAAWLAARLGEPVATASARVVAGAVHVDQRRERDPRAVLRGGERIVVHEVVARSRDWRVVHRDEDVLVVDKPAGLPSQATRDGGGALDEQVLADVPGARLLHRIDRDTSGLVMFTLWPDAHRRFAGILARGELRRGYQARVAEALPVGVVDAPIGPDPVDRRRFAVVASGRPARTIVVAVTAVGQWWDVELELVTGRTHQIRVHLSHLGCPILGDPLYALPPVRDAAPRLMLHAAWLRWPGGEARAAATY